MFFGAAGSPNFATSGMAIPGDESGGRLFAKLGALIQDGGAHKSVWHSRGDGGSKPCILCKNVWTEDSRMTDSDGTNLLRCNVLKYKDLAPAGCRDLRNAYRYLEAESAHYPNLKGEAFQK